MLPRFGRVGPFARLISFCPGPPWALGQLVFRHKRNSVVAIALRCNRIALQSHCIAIALHCNRIVLHCNRMQSHCIALQSHCFALLCHRTRMADGPEPFPPPSLPSLLDGGRGEARARPLRAGREEKGGEEEVEEGNEENDDDDADDDVEEGELDKKSGRARPLSLSRKGGREGEGKGSGPSAVLVRWQSNAKQCDCNSMRQQCNEIAMQCDCNAMRLQRNAMQCD